MSPFWRVRMKGYTLAEVLVTFGIIFVIVCLTVPEILARKGIIHVDKPIQQEVYDIDNTRD